MSMKTDQIEVTEQEALVISNADSFIIKMKTPDGNINRKTNGWPAMKTYANGLVEKHSRGARIYAQARINGVVQGALCATVLPNKGLGTTPPWSFR